MKIQAVPEPPRASSYPAKYDPRSSLGLPVRNQKPSNMCWAYTLAANLEISFLRNGAGLFDLSEEHLAYFFANRVNDPLGNTANDSNNLFRDYRDGGNQTLAAIFLSSWSGMALESQVPYRTNADHTTDYEDTPSSKMAYKTTAYLGKCSIFRIFCKQSEKPDFRVRLCFYVLWNVRCLL